MYLKVIQKATFQNDGVGAAVSVLCHHCQHEPDGCLQIVEQIHLAPHVVFQVHFESAQ